MNELKQPDFHKFVSDLQFQTFTTVCVGGGVLA